MKKASSDQFDGYYAGYMLVATTNITDSVFHKSVVYVFEHNEQGAMGMVINHPLSNLPEHISIKLPLEEIGEGAEMPKLYLGGPVEVHKGFVLHTPEYVSEDSFVSEGKLCLTSNKQIMLDVIEGRGPEHAIMLVGYSAWGPGQLESEIKENGWLTVPFDLNMVFNEQDGNKWIAACRSVGVDPFMMSEEAGSA